MNGVSQITVTEDVTLVTFHEFPAQPALVAEIFSDFAKAGINLDMICQTAPKGRQIDISFTLPTDELIKVLEETGKFREKYADLHPMVSGGNCKILLYGEEMRQKHGVAAAAISVLAQTPAELILITTSETEISLLVPQSHYSEAVKSLETCFSVKADSQL